MTWQPLPPYPASQNERVYVSVTGGTRDFNNDLSSLVVASLQSDLGLVPADSEGDANILIDIAVRDLYVAAIGGKKINGGHALANTAMATSLGIVIGSIAGDDTIACFSKSPEETLQLLNKIKKILNQ